LWASTTVGARARSLVMQRAGKGEKVAGTHAAHVRCAKEERRDSPMPGKYHADAWSTPHASRSTVAAQIAFIDCIINLAWVCWNVEWVSCENVLLIE
jgi:hypothetical protein